VARVVLKEKALAKSHRPLTLFKNNTCPVIGGETFGNLLLSVSNSGLKQLEQHIGQNTSDQITADISTIEFIKPYTGDDAARPYGINGLNKTIVGKSLSSVKLRLFQHKRRNQQVRSAFFELVKSLGIPEPERIQYHRNLLIYRIRDITPDIIPKLSSFVGTQSIGIFPQFRLFAQYIPQGVASHENFPPPNPKLEYPVVGLIDSGTDPNNKLLQAWIVDRDEEDVPRADQDNNHGSFVAGLIINGHRLNHADNRFPNTQAKIIDVIAMTKDNAVLEDDLLGTIRRVVRKYRDVRIWNLSLSRTDMTCLDDGFSHFAMVLDEIQREYHVTFVTCAGNYETSPLRGWPPNNLGEEDRVFPPADSALGVTVGSMAHSANSDSRVQQEQPSPFSRRGPGAAFLPKPEVCHYGGNCSANLDYQQVGVLSLDGSGNVSEAIGTSFSTPLVTSILSNIRGNVVDPISPNLAKALLIQSARLRSSEPLEAEHLRYKGFGIPGDVDEILTCSPWQATLIFEPEIQPQRRIFARENFPIPNCFRRPDRKVEGEFIITLVYDPPLEPAAGAEYCQVNVDVSLGTYDQGTNNKRIHCGKIPLEPKDIRKLYEKHLVEHGFKWSPVKVYRKKFSHTTGELWRLHLQMYHRAGCENQNSQKVALVVTMLDPNKTKPVYNDVVRAMNKTGWITQDLHISDQIRTRIVRQV